MSEGKTALVLSAGGMFGAYQAGAFGVIADRFQFDLVVGTSVGALNGWPIAGGCSPDELIRRWLDPATGDSLRLVPNPGLRNGWFNPAPLQKLTSDLMAQYTPQIPFAMVTLALPRFKTTVFQYPEITAEHLRASSSIPYFLPAVEIHGTRYLDGGVFEKCPLRVAMDLGATRIIAVDCLPDMAPRPVRLVLSALRRFRHKTVIPPGLELTLIEPTAFMGTPQDAVFWKEANVRRWIDLGRADAARLL